MLDLVLVDTSAWVDFFRGRQPVADVVDVLLGEERVVIHGVIRAELLQGTRSDRDFETLRGLLDALPALDEPSDLWVAVGRLGARARRAGVNGVGIPDLVIALVAEHNGVPLLTLDAHFQALAGNSELRLLS
jgi:tRNA(fMet)-specific endonuclease VapC